MQSTNLNLPYIAPSQAQKHVTHNEALRALDALVQLSVESASLAAAPPSPLEGARYIIAAASSGVWAGRQGAIAAFQDGGWLFYAPKPGFIAHVRAGNACLLFDGVAWVPFASTAPQGITQFGINATPDSINRLSVKSDAVLLDHNGSSTRVKVNKASVAQTASLLFQSNYSGRAEIGLQGDDSFRIKISADGANWREVLSADHATGLVKTGGVEISTSQLANILPDSGRFSGNSSNGTFNGISFAAPSYLAAVGGATITAKAKYIIDSVDYGGLGGALDPSVKSLLETIRTADARRYGLEWYVARLIAGTSVAEPALINGTNYGLAFTNTFTALPKRFTATYYTRAISGNVVVLANHGLASRVFINGVVSSVATVLTPADGWKHICIHGVPNINLYNYRMFQLLMPVAGEALLAMPSVVFGHADIAPETGVIMNSKMFE